MTGKSKKVQKTITFDSDVLDALEKKMKMSHNSNWSAMVNDGLRYAMFPEYRDDRDADLVKLYNQFSVSLAQHRKKTARDLAFMQEMLLKSMFNFYLYNPDLPESEQQALEAQAKARLNQFMEEVVRDMPALKPISDREQED